MKKVDLLTVQTQNLIVVVEAVVYKVWVQLTAVEEVEVAEVVVEVVVVVELVVKVLLDKLNSMIKQYTEAKKVHLT